MLERLPPEALIEARAAYAVVPLPDSWREAGTVAAANHNEWETYKAGKAGRRSVDPSRIHKAEDYVPRLVIARREVVRINQASINAHQAAMEERYLGHNR